MNSKRVCELVFPSKVFPFQYVLVHVIRDTHSGFYAVVNSADLHKQHCAVVAENSVPRSVRSLNHSCLYQV